jgi:hypothetical protein
MTTLAECKALKPPAVEQQQNDTHPCDGTLRIECCCPPQPQLRTRTISVDVPAQDEQAVQAAVTGAANGLEANGWLILGHSWNFVVGQGGAVATVNLGYYA